jgi:RES domain-containing protein
VALDVDATRVTGRWVRHAYPGAGPVPRRDPAPDGRWQRGDIVDALYLADEPATAWAEWYRHLAELGLPPDRQMPRELWTWELDVEVADLSDETRLARIALPRPRPGRRGWLAFQQVGEALVAQGWAGLIAPSAARPAHCVVCLFRAEATEPGKAPQLRGARPLEPPLTVAEVPPPPTGMTT